jgi:nucleotide-binding universal stress UspA family protein
MVSRILVAVDGSENSQKAAQFATSMARATGARLLLLTVLERPWMVAFGPLDAYAVGPGESDEQVAAAHKQLDDIGREFPEDRLEKHVELGDPAEVICEQAGKLGADLVVVGARGQGAVSRWLMGSVSDRVVHHCPVPVTVVR